MQYLSSILFVGIFIWLVSLSVLTIWIFNFFRKLSSTVGTKDTLIKMLTKILDTQNKNSNELIDIERAINFLKTDGGKHIQKIGLIRYNPFAEMGGDHSFTISILNGEDTGFVLTALHTRDRTRLYVKEIEYGKCKIELSEHEKKSIEKAKKH